jgi:hypothetical protein
MKRVIILISLTILLSNCNTKNGIRTVISLNGSWDIAVTDTSASLPAVFPSRVQVPGLVDMAVPAIQGQDTVYENSVYWYRRTFRVENMRRDIISLKINKAMFHTRVFVNGKPAGENIYNFTPSFFDIKPFLNTDGKENELIIAVGCRNNLPDTVTNGWDFEKVKYIPGIYDDVKILTADYPYINNIQTVPDPIGKNLRVVAEIKSNNRSGNGIKYIIRESVSKKIIASGSEKTAGADDAGIAKADFVISFDSCRLWSPDDPFLYDIDISTAGDIQTVRFGMRSFAASADSGIFLLNGKPYYMRGTNVCIYRFFEDPDRDGLPWNSEWVTLLHNRFKEMHWNSIRYCIGFPPERWYEIADSLGFLIQDEYPVWTLGKQNFKKYLGNLSSKQLAAEYREWMRERWNHPCVVVWDGQNESLTDTTGKAIKLVRHLDLSDRPWDNGWAVPDSRSDAIESHPYLFSRYMSKKPGKEGYLKEIMGKPQIPFNDPNSHYPLPEGKRYENPIILNEYGWIWLNRNGSTTTLTDKVYENVFPQANTAEKRLETYAKNLGMLTEYWRSYRYAAAVMHFCGLGYSRPERPRGQTSDHFIDLKNLTYEPNFYNYVKQAFSPVGLMTEFWEESVTGGREYLIPVHIINDTYLDFNDTLKINLFRGNDRIFHTIRPVRVSALGKAIFQIPVAFPQTSGKHRLEAEIVYSDRQISSIREFSVK